MKWIRTVFKFARLMFPIVRFVLCLISTKDQRAIKLFLKKKTAQIMSYQPRVSSTTSNMTFTKRVVGSSAKRNPSSGGLTQHGSSSSVNSSSKQTQLWSAVALQQHMLRSIQGLPNSKPAPQRAPTDGEQPRLTLAERMGLVEAPPAPPTEDEWSFAVDKSTHRNDCGKECSICQSTFVSSHASAQVILSCSHVFHEQCIKQFEKFARRAGATPSCPLCRSARYHKRVFYQGKAQVQNHAASKIQALVRGFLARKRYLTLRLRSNPKFRIDYAANQLKAISDTYTIRATLREKQLDRFLDDLDLTRQKALADMFSKRDWEDVRNKILSRHDGLECPICMGTIDSEQEAAPLPAANHHQVARAGPHAYMLSCAHCFHGPCLQSFESFSAANAADAATRIPAGGGDLTISNIPRCPVCRAGYAKRSLIDE